MAILEGKQLAHEGLLQAASLVLNAYYKAPMVTSRVNLKSLVLTREDFMPMIELVGKMEESLGREGASSVFFPLYMDYLCYRDAFQRPDSPVVLVLGANLMTSELGWNCGACGFPSCAEFNRFSKESGGMGAFGGGPSCAWKVIDYCIAVDYACSAAHQLSLENRIQATFGAVAYLLGYLEDCSMILTLPLGPVTELWYYNRPSLAKLSTYSEWVQLMRQNYTWMFQMFSSSMHPWVKDDGPWWEKEHTGRDTVKVAHDPELEARILEARGKLLEVTIELRQKVQEIKQRKGINP